MWPFKKKKRLKPEIVAVKNTVGYFECPICDDYLSTLPPSGIYSRFCVKCGVFVYDIWESAAATKNGPKPTIQEVQSFLATRSNICPLCKQVEKSR